MNARRYIGIINVSDFYFLNLTEYQSLLKGSQLAKLDDFKYQLNMSGLVQPVILVDDKEESDSNIEQSINSQIDNLLSEEKSSQLTKQEVDLFETLFLD